MPKVPQRKLSYGENLERQRKLLKHKESIGTKNFDKFQDSTNKKHGVVRIKAPKNYPSKDYSYGKITKRLRDILSEE